MFMGESSPTESGSQDSYSVSAQSTETEKTAEADSGTLELSPEELEAVNQTAKETLRETVKKFEESNADRYRNGYGQITYYLKKPEVAQSRYDFDTLKVMMEMLISILRQVRVR